MRKFTLLWILLVFIALPLGPARAAAAPACPNPAALTLDGVALSMCLPFALSGWRLPEPDNKIQVAAAADAAGERELAITTVPLGTQPASEMLPLLLAGQAESDRALLRGLRAQQGGLRVPSARMTLFGQAVGGDTYLLSIQLDGVHPQTVQLSEWLAEAGGRIWLVRLSETRPGQPVPDGLSLAALDPSAPSTSLASLRAGPSAAAAPPPAALPDPLTNLPTPAWWSGECDTTHYQAKNGRPAYPLGASYLGMAACGPRFADYPVDTLVGFFYGAWGEYEWECVELSMRFLYLAYGINPYSANGNSVVANYNGTRLVKISNKTAGKAPQPGDVISYNPYSSVGHTAVVTASSVDAYGNGTVSIIEENASANGARTHTVSAWNVIDSQGVIGWLHDPTHDNQQPPVVTFSPLNPAANHWYNTNQTVAWASSDYVGMWGYSQAWDADPGGTAPQVTTSASGSADLSGLSSGQAHTLYVRVWDTSPNHNTQVYSTGWYALDATPPVGGLGGFLEGQTISTRSLPITISPLADAGGSGLSHARLSAAWTGQSGLEVLSNISTAGGYALDLCQAGIPDGVTVSLSLDVWDQAGNVSLAAGGVRHFVKNYACSTPAQVGLAQPSSLTPLYTTPANECTHYWKQFTDINSHPAYLTLNAGSAANSTNSARWAPTLPATGQYKVEVFIPHHTYLQICNTAPPGADTGSAQYLVQYQGGSASVPINQQAYADQWVTLGTYTFAAGATGSVELKDLTGEANLSRYVVFSEMRFTPLVAPPVCFGISVGVHPPGSADVTLTPPNCGSQYTPGTAIQVTLTPKPGMTFNRWEGSPLNRANPRSLSIAADQVLVAYFDYPNSVFIPTMQH